MGEAANRLPLFLGHLVRHKAKISSQSAINHFRSISILRDEDFPSPAEEWLSGFGLVSPIEYVAGIAPRPLLLVHGNQNEMVDVSHTYKLYDRAKEPKQIIIY